MSCTSTNPIMASATLPLAMKTSHANKTDSPSHARITSGTMARSTHNKR
ncbi:MAG: hypothetical protein RJQ10_13485 [Haliea sp.]